MAEKKLNGKVALVTGGARGLGRGYVLRLAELGADVAIIDRNLKSFEVYEFHRKQMTAPTVMAECEALGVRAVGLEVDLVDRTATEKAVDEIVRQLGRIDIVVCNAGGGTVKFADEVTPGEAGSEREGESNPVDIATTGKPSDCPQDMLTRVMDINLMTCFYTCMAVAKHMKEQKSGKIITVSSGAGIDSRRLYHPYGTAKAAIIYYTRTLAQELGQYNITVNCIAPGLIHSGRNAPSGKIPRRIALGRWGTIEDCANVIEFLATNLSDYVTGKTITVDGGACEHR